MWMESNGIRRKNKGQQFGIALVNIHIVGFKTMRKCYLKCVGLFFVLFFQVTSYHWGGKELKQGRTLMQKSWKSGIYWFVSQGFLTLPNSNFPTDYPMVAFFSMRVPLTNWPLFVWSGCKTSQDRFLKYYEMVSVTWWVSETCDTNAIYNVSNYHTSYTSYLWIFWLSKWELEFRNERKGKEMGEGSVMGNESREEVQKARKMNRYISLWWVGNREWKPLESPRCQGDRTCEDHLQ